MSVALTWRTGLLGLCLVTVLAVIVGYRHIETAAAYGNEREVGCRLRIRPPITLEAFGRDIPQA